MGVRVLWMGPDTEHVDSTDFVLGRVIEGRATSSIAIDAHRLVVYFASSSCFAELDLRIRKGFWWGCLPAEMKRSLQHDLRDVRMSRRLRDLQGKAPLAFSGMLSECVGLVRPAFPESKPSAYGLDLCRRTIRRIVFEETSTQVPIVIGLVGFGHGTALGIGATPFSG